MNIGQFVIDLVDQVLLNWTRRSCRNRPLCHGNILHLSFLRSDVPNNLWLYFLYHLNCDSETFWNFLKASRIPETLGDGGGDVRLTLKACDDEIAFAHAYIQDLSARRNALLSVIRFPSEILASIFRFLLPVVELQLSDASHAYDDNAMEVGACTRSLIAASHVCRRWRDVALEHSTLWSIIWIDNTPWMHEMLSRSSGAPLTVIQPGHWPHSEGGWATVPVFANNTKNSTDNVDFLVSRLFQTIQPKHLSLHPSYMSTSTTTLWNSVLLRPAPLVETLQIVGGLPYTNASITSVSAQFLGRCAPALKHLSLIGPFSFDALWPSPTLRGLISLTLVVQQMNGEDSNSRISFRVVLDALQEMRHLEALSLTFPSLYTRLPPGTPPYFLNHEQEHSSVQLPRLSSLILSGGLTEIAALTSRLDIPQRATIQTDVILREDEVPEKVVECASKLIHPIIPLSVMKTLEITVANNIDCTLYIRCWDHTLPAHAYAPEHLDNPQAALRFSIPWPNNALNVQGIPPPGMFLHPHPYSGEVERQQTRKLVEVLHAVSVFVSCFQVHDLRWGGHPNTHTFGCGPLTIDESSYARALDHFPETRRLFFGDIHSCSDLIMAMASNNNILPHLTSIHFTSNFSREQALSEEERVPSPPEENRVQNNLQDLAAKLRRLAETRKIQTLEWRGGIIRQKYTPLFEGIAEELIWKL